MPTDDPSLTGLAPRTLARRAINERRTDALFTAPEPPHGPATPGIVTPAGC